MDLNDAEAMSLHLMSKYKLIQNGWKFKYDKATKRLGATHFRTRYITLSKTMVLASPRQEVEQIMLHEIAHALLPHTVGHGPEWKRLAARIGYRGSRTAVNRSLDFTGKPQQRYVQQAKQYTLFMKEFQKHNKGR